MRQRDLSLFIVTTHVHTQDFMAEVRLNRDVIYLEDGSK